MGSVPGTAAMTIALRFAGSAPDAAPALVIASGTANDGSFEWTIPASVAPGDYFLRVRTDDATVKGDGPVFKIVSSPAIIVKRPTANGEFCLGDDSNVKIKWDTACTMQGTVTITLRTAGSATDAAPALVIATGEANDGFFSWTVPASVAPGDYFIRVRTDDATVIGDGEIFKIKECDPSLKLLAPNGGEDWRIGDSRSIAWKKAGWSGKVKLILMYKGEYMGDIARNVPGEPSIYNWQVGTLLSGNPVNPRKGYRVRVVREYPGPVSMAMTLMDWSDGDFTIHPKE
jgi:hypothetical protein